MSRVQAEPFCAEVEGLFLRGKYWPGVDAGVGSSGLDGADQGLPILALHGWLDNAASFDALAAALPQHTILALDLPGHGHSDHKPASGSYAIWDDLRCLAGVLQQLGWRQCVVIGHSRGAIIATLLASVLPDTICAVCCLDGFIAEPATEAEAAGQLRRYVRDYRRSAKPPRAHHSLEELVAARQRKMTIDADAAKLLIQRSTRQQAGQWVWRSDRRLVGASPLKLTLGQWQAVLDAIDQPLLIIAASQGFADSLRQLPLRLGSTMQRQVVEGTHHCHMRADTAAEIARRLTRFFNGVEASERA